MRTRAATSLFSRWIWASFDGLGCAVNSDAIVLNVEFNGYKQSR